MAEQDVVPVALAGALTRRRVEEPCETSLVAGRERIGYARGEISREEFEERRRTLVEDTGGRAS